MIHGIGTDIVDIRRIESVLKKNGDRFKEKIFSEAEIAAAKKIRDKKKKISYFAKRFAAKEAFAKATGKGIGEFAAFKDISIENEKSGKPFIKLRNKKMSNIYVSLSDEYPYAQAFVVIGKNRK